MSFQIDSAQICAGFHNAAAYLKQQKDLLNHLNVFPVADQDTGVNMYRSMDRAAKRLSAASSPCSLFQEAYYQLLEYAHGNSGTILTLFFEGFSSALPDKDTFSGRDLALAFQKGAENAEHSVADPMPGTILSVASQSAAAGLSMLDLTEDAGLIFKRITDEAHAALLLTTSQNPTLQKHQVIDSGAYGFCLILDGFLDSFAPDLPREPYPAIALPGRTADSSTQEKLLHRYCTEFVLEQFPDTSVSELDSCIRPHGEYFLCVSNGSLCKVHIHTNHPEAVLQLAGRFGTIRSQKIDDMAVQTGADRL